MMRFFLAAENILIEHRKRMKASIAEAGAMAKAP